MLRYDVCRSSSNLQAVNASREEIVASNFAKSPVLLQCQAKSTEYYSGSLVLRRWAQTDYLGLDSEVPG